MTGPLRVRKSLLTGMMTAGLVAVLSSIGSADLLTGLSGTIIADDAIVSITHDGSTYTVANGDLVTGTTTRWYIDGGQEVHWVDGEPAPVVIPDPGGTTPKVGDIGANADNFLFAVNGVTNMSSIDGVNFQQTIFQNPTDTFFVFERGGNDSGTFQAILDVQGTLGAEVALTAGSTYTDTGFSVNGQNAFAGVFTTDVPVLGIRITAPGHDAFSVSSPVPEPSTILMFALGLAVVGMVRIWRGRK